MRVISTFIICAIFLSCSEEPPVLFTVRTGLVSQINPDGAVFTGEIHGLKENDVISYGFQWWTTPPSGSDNRYYFSDPKEGSFEKKMTIELKPGKVYNVRVLADTKNGLIVADPVKFTSQGCKGPEIVSFTPSSGSYTDYVTVTLHGNFSQDLSSNIVTLGTQACYVQRSDGESLDFIVPAYTYGGPYKISVNVDGMVVESKESYTIIH